MSIETATGISLICGVICLAIAIYQLRYDDRRKASNFFIAISICCFLFIWQHYEHGKTQKENVSVVSSTPNTVAALGAVPVPTPSPTPDATLVSNPISLVKENSWENAWPRIFCEPEWVPAKDNQDNQLKSINMWVEGITRKPQFTIVHASVRSWTDETVAKLQSAKGAYITDDQGRAYDLQKEFRMGSNNFVSDGEVRPAVIERFELWFPETKPTHSITLSHPQFSLIKVYEHGPVPQPSSDASANKEHQAPDLSQDLSRPKVMNEQSPTLLSPPSNHLGWQKFGPPSSGPSQKSTLSSVPMTSDVTSHSETPTPNGFYADVTPSAESYYYSPPSAGSYYSSPSPNRVLIFKQPSRQNAIRHRGFRR
jgi:hypothetical protein